MPQWEEEPEEDRREGKEDLPDKTVLAYGLWVPHAGEMGNTVGADGGGGRHGDRGEGERVGLEQEELGVAGGERCWWRIMAMGNTVAGGGGGGRQGEEDAAIAAMGSSWYRRLGT